MTSRKKITAITKAAKKYNCAVYLKTGAHPPGIMIAEAEAKEALKSWVGSVKNLRYKDYKLLRSEAVDQGKLLVEPGSVKEFDSTKAMVPELAECEILDWWKANKGLTKSED